MPPEKYIFKIRRYRCVVCGETREELAWEYDTVTCCNRQMIEIERFAVRLPTYADGVAADLE